MVKKLKQMAEKQSATPLLDSALAGTVKASAHQIWLAGLGAFAKAQQEGGKVFDALVREGTALQKRTQSAAGEKIGEVTGRVSSMAGDVTAKAGQQWDKLEAIFEERTSRALSRLGVPSARDIEALMQRIDDLSAQVEQLARAGGAEPVRVPVKRARTARAAAVVPAAAGNGTGVPKASRRAAARKPAA